MMRRRRCRRRAARRLSTLLAGLLLAGAAAAQTPLALRNVGSDIRMDDAATEGRGGWGLSVRDTLAPSLHNPAALTGQRNVALLAGGFGEHITSKEQGRERTTNTVHTPSLGVVVPALAGRAVFSLGLRGLRATQYERVTQEDGVLLDPDDPADTVAVYTVLHSFTREGTQFRVPFSLAVRVAGGLSLAGSLNLENGVFRERASDIYVEPVDAQGNPLLRSTSEYLEDDIDGTSTTWSLHWQLSSRLAVGAQWTPAHGWDLTRVRDMAGLPGDRRTVYGVHLPDNWSLGAHWRTGGRWRAGFEFEYADWGDFSGRSDWEAELGEAWRIAVGLERREAFRRRAGTANLPLRIGFTLQQWPYRQLGERIRDHRITVGTGVPLHQRRGHLDVALGYGWRGDDTRGVADRYWRLSISVAGLERWW